MFSARSYLLGSLFLGLAACQSAAAESPPLPEPATSAAAPAVSATKEAPEPRKRAEGNRTYSLPFVREPGSEDPGERARSFLRDLVRDNGFFVRNHDSAYFKTFAEAQRPRATFVTCSDSRVQSPAFDATPDNDLFTIRNIGNQLHTAKGSVQYGVEHLKTPLLVIVGHSGCGAVKAAMGDFSHEPDAIRRELETLDLSPLPGEPRAAEKHAKSKTSESPSWIDAVVINVHHQVAAALEEYSESVSSHDLIVVGAVYDFRNELRHGLGGVSIVNVNGYTDAAKIEAFMKAIDDRPLDTPRLSSTAVLRDFASLPTAGSSTAATPTGAAPAGRESPSGDKTARRETAAK